MLLTFTEIMISIIKINRQNIQNVLFGGEILLIARLILVGCWYE